jgi:polyhydroxyalkanoate synthesis regulator phasin
MADEGQRRQDPADALRDGVRAVGGILGAFKDAIEQTFNDLSEQGDISPERARDAARDAMRRAQDAMDDMRGRVDFVTRREFEALRADVDTLKTQVERHATHGGHHTHGGAAGATGAAPGTGAAGGTAGTGTGGTGTGGTGTGAGGSAAGDGSPGL